MIDEKMVSVLRVVAGALIGCVGTWKSEGDPVIAITALGVAAFIAVGHC